MILKSAPSLGQKPMACFQTNNTELDCHDAQPAGYRPFCFASRSTVTGGRRVPNASSVVVSFLQYQKEPIAESVHVRGGGIDVTGIAIFLGRFSRAVPQIGPRRNRRMDWRYFNAGNIEILIEVDSTIHFHSSTLQKDDSTGVVSSFSNLLFWSDRGATHRRVATTSSGS